MNGCFVRACFLVLPLVAFSAGSWGCGPTLVDLEETLEVIDLSTGWVEGTKDDRTRIVPAVSFALRKRAPDTPLTTISITVAFRREPGDEQFDDVYLKWVDVGPEGAAPMLIQADTGYTGDPPQTGADLLQHADFRDLSARILVRQPSGGWTELESVLIERRLLAR